MRYGTKDAAWDHRAFTAMVKTARANARTEREKLIAQYMPMVLGRAKKFSLQRRHGRPVTDELLQEGLSALVLAADGFDPSRGVKFITYASRVVWNRFINLGRDEKRKKLPLCETEERSELRGISIQDPVRRLDEIRHAKWIYENALRRMDARMRDMTRMRYQRGATGAEMAAKYGISESRVNQLFTREYSRIRSKLEQRGVVA